MIRRERKLFPGNVIAYVTYIGGQYLFGIEQRPTSTTDLHHPARIQHRHEAQDGVLVMLPSPFARPLFAQAVDELRHPIAACRTAVQQVALTTGMSVRSGHAGQFADPVGYKRRYPVPPPPTAPSALPPLGPSRTAAHTRQPPSSASHPAPPHPTRETAPPHRWNPQTPPDRRYRDNSRPAALPPGSHRAAPAPRESRLHCNLYLRDAGTVHQVLHRYQHPICKHRVVRGQEQIAAWRSLPRTPPPRSAPATPRSAGDAACNPPLAGRSIGPSPPPRPLSLPAHPPAAPPPRPLLPASRSASPAESKAPRRSNCPRWDCRRHRPSSPVDRSTAVTGAPGSDGSLVLGT